MDAPADESADVPVTPGPFPDAALDAGGGLGDAPAATPAIVSFTASPITISAGSSSTLSWTVTGATMLAIDQGAGSPLVSVLGTTSQVVTPSQTTTYTLTLNGAVSAQVTVTVVPLPLITSFSVSPTVVTGSDSATLTAVFSGGTGTVDQDVGDVTSGSGKSTGPVGGTTTYTLTVTNGVGGYSTAQVTLRTTSTCACDSGATCFQGPLIVLTPANPTATLTKVPITAPGWGLHDYTSKYDLDVSAFSSGGTISVSGTLGSGCAGSFDLLGECTDFVSAGSNTYSLAHYYDCLAGNSFSFSYPFEAGDTTFHLGLEGDWSSPAGQTNTVAVTIAVVPWAPDAGDTGGSANTQDAGQVEAPVVSETCAINGMPAPAGTICRVAVDVCDVAEYCTGISSACPTDRLLTKSAVCRPAVSVCDVAEFCDGTHPACPTDAFAPTTTQCRPSSDGNVCDPAEFCTGTSNACPADAKYTRPTAPPTGVAVAPGTLQADVSWTPSTGDAGTAVTGYNVKISSISTGGWSTPGSPTTSPFTVTPITAGPLFYFVVSAYDGLPTCESANSSPPVSAQSCAATAPTTLTATPDSTGSVVLTWAVASGAATYNVSRSTTKGGPYTVVTSGVSATSYQDSPPVPSSGSATFYYVVRANTGDCNSPYSPEAAAVAGNAAATP